MAFMGLAMLLFGWGQKPMVCNKNVPTVLTDRLTIFNGKNLDGWTGHLKGWKVENGELVGTAANKREKDRATWIRTEQKFEDFELSMWVKLLGDRNRNSGVYYRGQWDDEEHVVGYEFDFGGWAGEKELWWGELHDPYRRPDFWIKKLEKEELISLYNKKGWNHIRIRAEGDHIQHWLNGIQTVDWYEKDSTMQKQGFIAFQLHDETRFEVRIRNIELIPIK
tara:strand:+ start:1483 stop:2148 length:666 start_codon:yes stop_codon:yes gene_type:complete